MVPFSHSQPLYNFAVLILREVSNISVSLAFYKIICKWALKPNF